MCGTLVRALHVCGTLVRVLSVCGTLVRVLCVWYIGEGTVCVVHW